MATCRLIPGKERSSNAPSVRGNSSPWLTSGSTRGSTLTSDLSAATSAQKRLKGETFERWNLQKN